MSYSIRPLILLLLICLGLTAPSTASAQRQRDCLIEVTSPFQLILAVQSQHCGADRLLEGTGTVSGFVFSKPTLISITMTSTFVRGKPSGQTTFSSDVREAFTGTMSLDGKAIGVTTFSNGGTFTGEARGTQLWQGVLSRNSTQGGTRTFYLGGVVVPEATYSLFQRGQLASSTARVVSPISKTSQSVLNCTAYISYPLQYEGIGLQYQGNCPSGYAEGQQTINAEANGTRIIVTSDFKSGSISGQTEIQVTQGVHFSGVVNRNGSLNGKVIFRGGRYEEGTLVNGRIHDGIAVTMFPQGVEYYDGGRRVNQDQYQVALTRNERPSYAYTSPTAPSVLAPSAAPPAPPPRRSAERRRRGDECTIDRPTQWYSVRGTYEGECEGGRFTGTAILELDPLEQGDPRVKLKVPYRRGTVSGQVVAEYPQMNSVFKGSLSEWEPQDGQMIRNLGNRNYLITDYQGGYAVSSRQEFRPPSDIEILLYSYLGAVVDQQVNKLIDDTFNGPERRRERRRIQATETAQREAQQAQERQNAENVRLANEANARQVAERAQAEAARLARQAESDRQYAERQAQSQRDYEARQAEAAERERQRQVAEQEREAARQRQMAQNTFSVTTQPPEFGGTTGAPVVSTTPREGVPPPLPSGVRLSEPQPDLRPTLGTNRQQNEPPPPLPPPTRLPDLQQIFNEQTPVPPPTRNPDPLPSGQDLRPSFPSQPAEPVQAPTRNDTLGSGSANSQPTAPSYSQPTRTTQQVSSPSVPNVPTGMYPGYYSRNYVYDFELSFPFAWNTVAGATSYQIAVRDLTSGSIAFEGTVRGNRITPPTPFTAGREYVWDVAACNATGCSTRSRDTYFRTAGGSSQTPTQQATRPRPSDAGTWSSNFARDAFDAAGDGTQKCAIALAQQTGESVEAAFQLITSAGGWQSLVNSVTSSVWNMIRHPILSLQAAWNGLTGQVSGVRDAVSAGDASLACQRAVQLSGTVIGTAGGAQAARASLGNLRRVVSNSSEVTQSAVAKVPSRTQANAVQGGAVVAASRGVWSNIDTTLRGNLIHKGLGQNTPDNFPAVDLWNPNTGHAVSIKSMDTATSYQTASGFRSALKTHIDQIANFRQGRLQWLEIREGQVRSRELLIAIPPEGINAAQQQALGVMREYAAGNNVSIRLVTYGY